MRTFHITLKIREKEPVYTQEIAQIIKDELNLRNIKVKTLAIKEIKK